LLPTADDLDDPLGFGERLDDVSVPDDLSALEVEPPRSEPRDDENGTDDTP
jgi:hypothetical protein